MVRQFIAIELTILVCLVPLATVSGQVGRQVTLNQQAAGYRGIWYMNQPSHDPYVYKYSGGLGTYCAKHRPFAIYAPEVNRTFFCYGGAKAEDNRALLHMVGYFDHPTKRVSRPTILLDKQTGDAHDNPVISLDSAGHIWIFSTSHGRARPSYIHRSVRPYQIDKFERVEATRLGEPDAHGERKRVAIDNFSYMQVWHTRQVGFAAFFTRYRDPAARTLMFMTSPRGRDWSEWKRLAAIEEGHYQVSAAGPEQVLATMFNYHPRGRGLNWRTNLYFLQTRDRGESWQTVEGEEVELPLVEPDNPALVRDYRRENRNVYLKDLQFDAAGHPVLLYLTSKGYQAGPENDPRIWTVALWSGQRWQFHEITKSDNNYDAGELQLRAENEWVLIAPTEPGPQPYNPGGEVAMWVSRDRGQRWQRRKQMTDNSERNHTYVRRVENGHPDMVAFWADGHGRKPSRSLLYFADSDGSVFQFPREMAESMARPVRVPR